MADYPLIKPEVPNAQENKAPFIMLEAMRTGLQAAAQFAQMRRQSESEIMRLAEHERLAEEQLSFEREKIGMDFDIRQSTLDSTRTLNEAHAEYYKAGAEAYATGTKTAAQRAIAFNQQRQALVTEVNDQAAELQLNDPAFATKEPVKFAANVMQFEDTWRLSPLPEVRNAIKQYRALADEQKIPIKVGAKFDAEAKTWSGGETERRPIWQVVRNLQDPLTQEQMMADLEASGHTRVIKEFETIGGKQVPVERTEPTPLIKSYLEKAEGVKFERVPSRVAPAMLPKSAAGGTSPTELPLDIPDDTTTDPQASNARRPQFEPTETDNYLSQAKAAIAKGAAMPAVAQRLVELGIDPAHLWAA